MQDQSSLLKFYRGNRFIGRSHPLVVVLGDTSFKATPFAEHYIFHSVPGLPFLFQRVSAAQQDTFGGIDFSEFPEVFSAQALLEHEIDRARDHFEFAIAEKDRELHRQLFWSDSTFDLLPVDKHPFAQFRIFGTFTSEMQTMFKFTRSRSLRIIERDIAQYPQCAWRTDPDE
jgi:hypothetical protein